METSYTIFRPDGTEERGTIDWPEDPGYDRIRKFVEPIVEGPIEHVLVLPLDKRDAVEISRSDYRDMFVDEMGHVRKTGPGIRNETATRIYRNNWLRANPKDVPESIHWIAGTAILFDRIIWR